MTPKRLRDTSWFLGQQIPGPGDYRITSTLAAGLNAQVFVAHSDALGRDVACKVIPETNLIGREKDPPSWKSEITNANQMPSARVVKIFAMGSWGTPEGNCVYLLADLVQGKSLRDYLKEKKAVDLVFAEILLQELLDFLNELQSLKLTHGDLHGGNVLVEDRSTALTGPPFGIRITDFGVAPATTGARLLDDFEQVAMLLRETLELVDYQKQLAQDRLVFEFLRDDLLGKRLMEHDVSFDPSARDPRALFVALSEARKRSTRTAGSARKTLTTPFDYLSCEQIGEAHALLKELYSDKMLGLQEIEELNNLVLTGPRGCGKTTVFRCLGIKHRVSTDDDALESVKYIGLYYHCNDLYYSFPRYHLPSRTEGYDVPTHFLTVTLLRELMESLAVWLPRRANLSWIRSESEAAKDLWHLLEISKPQDPSAHTFRAVIAGLGKERARAARKQRFVNDPNQKFGNYFGPDMLLRACALLANHFVELADRPIFFLIDDYSAPKISADLQRNLNRLVMQRSAYCFFKLATESPASFLSNDIDGKSYVEGREFRLVNIGMDFINAAPDDKLRFVDDVFNKRFSYAENFPVKTLEAFVGDDPGGDYNESARQLRADKHPLVWGRHALGELCSGDVHFLIDLAGKMVTAVGGADELKSHEGKPAIAPESQHKAIRTEAGNFLKNLRALPKGPALVEIVEAFGNVASSYIRHRNSKNESSAPPHQATRIEPFEDPALSAEAREIYDDLLRYSVFLEDVRGKSRRGLVVPRLYLRRFLIPFFNLTFSKRDSLELNVEELHDLLLHPKQFESRKRLRGPDGETSTSAGGQLPLLPNGSDT
jgi:energy-coupling factor transporter ATP-binding protein EcfA2